MFFKLKKEIMDLAKNAVLVAETQLKTTTGKAKKKMAIDYIVEHLPLGSFGKTITLIFLSSFIDDVVELAVLSMKTFQGTKGE